jgi:hypothetical protein
MRRIAFFFAIRRCSLLEMNQRLLRIVLRIPLLTIFLRNRLSRESWDSPFRKLTEANEFTYFPYEIDQNQALLHGSCQQPARVLYTIHT